ncbi:MAG: hypothetical protein H6710_02915 [Myxococcales bacterium]|nr:hypothetical protein [Myxococcales bacterium]
MLEPTRRIAVAVAGACALACTSSAPRSAGREASVDEARADDASEIERPGPRELLVERASPDGSFTAEWWGHAPVYEPHESPYPIEYGIEGLWFRFADPPERLRFRPRGTLHFSDWQTDVIAPDGRRLVLLQDRFGPYHVVAAERLRDYLRGEAEPDQVIGWETRSPGAFVPVHGPIRWIDAATIEVLYDSETPERRRYALVDASGG